MLAFFYYNPPMEKRGRPRKSKRERKDSDLRIPMTQDQKAMVVEAARLAGEDMASWARPILLQAAQARIGGVNSQGQSLG